MVKSAVDRNLTERLQFFLSADEFAVDDFRLQTRMPIFGLRFENC